MNRHEQKIDLGFKERAYNIYTRTENSCQVSFSDTTIRSVLFFLLLKCKEVISILLTSRSSSRISLSHVSVHFPVKIENMPLENETSQTKIMNSKTQLVDLV